MRKIDNFCASCNWYDGYADTCGYPRSGCEKAEKRRNAPVMTDAAENAKACRGCRYLDRHSQACKYPGFGCVRWNPGKED